ncbi:MAG: endonuclease domain-containing protein [Chloroflexi bacterium]|nr:endonuclease domain-containing protein [Chloroflexota bacterium]
MRAPRVIQERARQLRREMTPAEKKLWARLRFDQLDGFQFRRQHAVGNFILDFFCAKAKLVVELDGDSHADQVEYDEERTKWLNEQKHYRVIRFTNREVNENIEAVVEKIREELKG